MTDPKQLYDALRTEYGEGILAVEGDGDDSWFRVRPEATHYVLERLRSTGYNLLVDLTAVDLSSFPGPKAPGDHFELTYRLLSLDLDSGLSRGRIAVKTRLEEAQPAPRSIMDLWPVADWLEREVWDMFGVPFSGRPGLKRILMYDEFKGHPLLKDYPNKQRQPLIGPSDAKPRERMTAADLRPRLVE